MNEILSAFDEKGSMFVFEYNELIQKTNKWYEELDKKELGKILGELDKKQILSEGFADYLDEIRKERNYFVHNVFKDDLFTKAFQKNPKQLIPRLQVLVDKMNAANEQLLKVSSEMKEDLKLIS
jgi:hypothetical protein